MNESRSDTLLPEKIETLLQRKLGNRIRCLQVHLVEGGLVLEGYTATYYAKQIAQHAAMEITGVPLWADNIEVR